MQSILRLIATPGLSGYRLQVVRDDIGETVHASEVIETSVAGLYEALLPNTLGFGNYVAQLSLSDRDFGTVSFVVNGTHTTDAGGRQVYSLNRETSDRLAIQPILDQIRDLQKNGVAVSRFTSTGLGQIRGSIQSTATPLPARFGFDHPIVQGDSYFGERAWKIRLTGYRGPSLLSASRIVLKGCRFAESFEWPFTVIANPENPSAVQSQSQWVQAELASSQTQVTAGEWTVALCAIWEETDEGFEQIVTLIGPDAKLQVVSLPGSSPNA